MMLSPNTHSFYDESHLPLVVLFFFSNTLSSSFIQFSLNCFLDSIFFSLCSFACSVNSIPKLVVFFYFYYHCLLCYHQAECALVFVFSQLTTTTTQNNRQKSRGFVFAFALLRFCIGPLFVWSLNVTKIFLSFYFFFLFISLNRQNSTPIHSYSFCLSYRNEMCIWWLFFIHFLLKCERSYFVRPHIHLTRSSSMDEL